ncbi:MAG: MFS transporter [Pseudomonadales bacterium]|nr:MFS transporter [Pseudomonadales bacterium]
MKDLSDAHYRWLVVGYTLLMQAVTVGVLIYCFALFALPWLEAFDAPRRDVMLAISLLQVGMGLVSPFAGRALDTLPMRGLLCVGTAAFAGGLWLVAHAGAWWQVLLVYALVFPFAMALTGTLASQTLVARWFRHRRGLAIGISAMGTNFGGMVFPFLVAGWLVGIGWRATLEWLALLGVVLILPLGWLVLGRQPTPVEAGHAQAAADLRVWTAREILGSRLFWIPVIAMLPLNTAFGAVQFNLGAYVQDLGYGPNTAARLIGLCSFSMIVGKLFFGALGDRLDHRYLYWLAAASMSIAMLALLGRPSLALLTVGVVCVGLAGGGILPMMGLIHGARFGLASFGRVMGLVMLTITLSATGPILAGWIFDLTGSYDTAFVLFLGLFAPGVVLMRWLPPPHG